MKFVRAAGCFLAVALPLRLLLDPRAVFYTATDWNNNLWLIAYFGEYFRHHLSMPMELNTGPAVGMGISLFYGYLLYPILGFFSAFVGADLALRLGCFGLVALQFYALLCAGRSVFRHRGLASAVAVTVIWSTYALTDLYNRSAISEYFATGCLMAAIGFGVAASSESSGPRRRFHAWLAGVTVVLALGIHPPTTVVGSLLLALIGVILALVGAWRRPPIDQRGLAVGLGCAALAALILGPWFYLTLSTGRRLATWADSFSILFYPDRSDSWLGRLSPVPYDRLSARLGTVNVSTPYLEAPLAFGLLILAAWFLAIGLRSRRSAAPAEDLWTRSARWVAPAGLGWGAFLLMLSLSPALAAHFLYLGIQFAYRLTSHVNAALLTVVFAAGALARQSGALARHRRQAGFVAALGVAVAALAVAIKLDHGAQVKGDQAAPEFAPHGDRSPLIADGRLDLAKLYAAPAGIPELDDREGRGATATAFPVGREGDAFGRVSAARVRVDRPGWVVTNAVAFPWSRILVNGSRSRGGELRRRGDFLAVQVPAGTTDLQWEWHPDPIWSMLHFFGQGAFMLVIVLTAFWPFAWSFTLRRAARSGRNLAEPARGRGRAAA